MALRWLTAGMGEAVKRCAGSTATSSCPPLQRALDEEFDKPSTITDPGMVAA